MTISLFLILFVGIVSLVGTIWIANNDDKQYKKTGKKRIRNLSFIYVALLVGSGYCRCCLYCKYLIWKVGYLEPRILLEGKDYLTSVL
ncbi:hypothetical protein P5663_18895 [Priestia flexa]|uniref:hypothetical protein n=1 Tax=Priestia flexa TaxID=86664 RepID=UPI003D92AFD5